MDRGNHPYGGMLLQRGNSPCRWQEILESPMELMIVRLIWGFLNTFFCFFNGRIYHIDTLNHDQFRFVSCVPNRYIITSFIQRCILINIHSLIVECLIIPLLIDV